jgi:hypothetical protein
MNSYHEIERFQRKAGQADFPFRHTGAPAFEHRETGWSLIDQVAAGVSVSPSTPSSAPVFKPSIQVPVEAAEPADTPPPGDEQAQDAALERFASLLQARHRREVEHDHPEAGDEQSLKQLLRRIAVGPGETNESWSTQC